MPFELYNPHPSPISCVFPQPIGEVIVPSKETVPSIEQEAEGLTALKFKDWRSPSFLVETPPAIRRRLLEQTGRSVPQDVLARTRHLPEYNRAPAPSVPASAGAAGAGSPAGAAGGVPPAGVAAPPSAGGQGAAGAGSMTSPDLSKLMTSVGTSAAAGNSSPGSLQESADEIQRHMDRSASSYRGTSKKATQPA